MPTQALAAYGSQLRLGNGVLGPVLSVTFVANTTPMTIAVSPNHGVPIGEVVWVTVNGVGGATAANGSWVAEAINVTTLELRSSVWNGVSWTSGGTVQTVSSFTHVAELVNIEPIGISFNMVDCSAHDGDGWGSSIPTQKTGVDMRITINLVPDHATHDGDTGMIFLAMNKVNRPWMVVFPDPGRTAVAFWGWVSDHGSQTPVDGVLRATPVISIDEEMIWGLPAVVP